MKKLLPALVALLAILVQEPIARAQGTITIALAQSVDINGRPLAGCFLYLYQVGTVATLQAVFSDPGLTNLLPNPLTCDQSGRLHAGSQLHDHDRHRHHRHEPHR